MRHTILIKALKLNTLVFSFAIFNLNASPVFHSMGTGFSPSNISSDGSTVVGSLNGVAAYFSLDAGSTALSRVSDNRGYSYITDVSDLGHFLVVNRFFNRPLWQYEYESFIHKDGVSKQISGGLPRTEARSITNDGATVVGVHESPRNAFSYNVATDTFTSNLHGFTETSAGGISGNGEVIVGYNYQDGIRIHNSTVGLVQGPDMVPTAISDDGKYLVGWDYASGRSNSLSYRWSIDGGKEAISDESDGFVKAVDVDATGETIVGNYTDYFGSPLLGFIWLAEFGQISVLDLFEQLDIDTLGLERLSIQSISSSGRQIVGTGYNKKGDSEGWLFDLNDADSLNNLLINRVYEPRLISIFGVLVLLFLFHNRQPKLASLVNYEN